MAVKETNDESVLLGRAMLIIFFEDGDEREAGHKINLISQGANQIIKDQIIKGSDHKGRKLERSFIGNIINILFSPPWQGGAAR